MNFGQPRPMFQARGPVGGFRRPFVPRGMMMANPMMGGGFGMMPFGGMMMGGGFPGAFGGGFGPMQGMFGGGMGRFSPYGRGGTRTRVGSSAVKVQPIPDGTDQSELQAVFEPYGTVTLAVIKEGTPRHGYVNFSTPQEAAAAAAVGTVHLTGQPCQVQLSIRKKAAMPEGAPTNGIGIFNIPFTTSQEELTSMLAAYPGFQTMKMVTNKMGEFKGYVFAYFDSEENATVAKQSLLGFQIGENTLDCKYSHKPAELALATGV